MKAQPFYKYIIFLLILFPVSLQAQWNISRYDKHNVFQRVLTIDADNAFVTGLDQSMHSNFVMRTTDGGTTWDSLNLNPDEALLELREIQFVNKNLGFLGGSIETIQHLLKTTDNGQTWTDITPADEVFKEIGAVSFIDANTGFAANNEKFYATTDGGANWTTYTPNFQIRDLHFIDANTGFASGTQMDSMNRAIMMKTTDGGQTWNYLLAYRDPSLFVSFFDKIDVAGADTLVTSMQNTNTFYRSTNGGQSWDTIRIDSAYYITDFDFTSANSGHILGDNGKIFYTNDGGKNWKMEYSSGWGMYGPGVYLSSLSIQNGIGFVTGNNGLIKKYKAGTLSVKERKNELQLNIFPNPISSNSFLQITMPQNFGVSTLTIINSCGQILAIEKLVDKSAIELQKLKMVPGIYYIRLQNNDLRTVQKLIVTQ